VVGCALRVHAVERDAAGPSARPTLAAALVVFLGTLYDLATVRVCAVFNVQ
jgi:hypothetical protein